MALLHPSSAAAAPDCLELFKIAETQTAVLKTYTVELYPTTTQPGGSPEFLMRGDSPDYCNIKDLKLCGSIRIVHLDGSVLPNNEKAMPINLYMHSLWKQVDIKLGNMILSHPQQMYHYKALMKTLLRRGAESKKTQAGAEGYVKDTPGKMDATEDGDTVRDRGGLFQVSTWVDFEGRLLEDCLEIDRYLLNNVPLSVKLVPASTEFVLMSGATEAAKKVKYEIRNLKLKVCMVSVSPGVILGHAAALKNANALYPFTRVEMFNHSVPAGDSNVHLRNLNTKSVPTRLVVGMVSAAGYNGAYKKNPYNFQHFNVTDISLVVNDIVVGGEPLHVNFDKTETKARDYVAAYKNMFSTTGTEGENFGNDIAISDFADGYALFCFNLEPFSKPGKYLNLVKTGFVRLSLQFGTPLTETIVIIIYSEHQDMFQIDAAKNIILT